MVLVAAASDSDPLHPSCREIPRLNKHPSDLVRIDHVCLPAVQLVTDRVTGSIGRADLARPPASSRATPERLLAAESIAGYGQRNESVDRVRRRCRGGSALAPRVRPRPPNSQVPYLQRARGSPRPQQQLPSDERLMRDRQEGGREVPHRWHQVPHRTLDLALSRARSWPGPVYLGTEDRVHRLARLASFDQNPGSIVR